MKHITLIISLTLAVFSFGSCITVDDLRPENPYEQPEDRPNGSEQDKPLASSATDLASAGKTANCYIVSSAGTYKFKPLKGNSSTSVGSVSSVEVLWESFGTYRKPSVGDLIRTVNYDAGFIVFSTPSSFKEGNAVIAAKDASGEILWSWHIWLTDQPKEQVYYNNAGTMMDRNLGATSSTPGDVGALGLLYQWGRKDPFLGSSSISDEVEAKSTVTWPSSVTASTSKGNVDYATANPMTFILGTESSEYDWHYSSRNNDLWTSSKTIYDPCPAGWRVPDGGEYGVWSKACDSSSSFDYQYDGTDEGMNFSGKFGSASVIWYPASGYRACHGESGSYLGYYGGFGWSASIHDNIAYSLGFLSNGLVFPSNYSCRDDGLPVRCLQEYPAPAKKAQVVFNELCGNKAYEGNKFIELFNAGEAEGSLEGWTIRKYAADATDVAGKYNVCWTAPAGKKLAAGAYLVLGADLTDPELGFNAGLSAKKGVKFELVDADGKVVDKFVRGADVDPFGEEPLDENKEASFSRVPNGTGEWAYAAPTPGEANGEKTGDI